MLRRLFAFILAALVAFLLSCLAMTGYTLAEYAAIGLSPTPGVAFETYWLNLIGLGLPTAQQPLSFGLVEALGLLVAFMVAGLVKRVVPVLSPFAYPVAGAVALPVLIILIENVMIGGGVGVFYGARGPLGLGLQALAGLAGGLVFSLLRRRGRD